VSVVLAVKDLEVAYGSVTAVRGVDLQLEEGELRVILGPNGAGKSTILKAIAGQVKVRAGTIEFPRGRPIQKLPPHRISELGLSWVPEGREIFVTLTVEENLLLGAFATREGSVVDRRLRRIYEQFPILKERQHHSGGALSGGEQQLLAIARGLMSEPRVLLMDEPSLGLAPIMVATVFDLIRQINDDGVSVLMVEQNARQALAIADYAYLLEVGSLAGEGPAAELAASDAVQRVYFGGRARGTGG
jgi:branched-chain amino acid transport system ATP-binding protein